MKHILFLFLTALSIASKAQTGKCKHTWVAIEPDTVVISINARTLTGYYPEMQGKRLICINCKHQKAQVVRPIYPDLRYMRLDTAYGFSPAFSDSTERILREGWNRIIRPDTTRLFRKP